MWPLLATAQDSLDASSQTFIESSSTEGTALLPVNTLPVHKALTPKEQVEIEFADTPVMIRIAKAESSYDPTAKNPGSTATGLYQILLGTWHGYHCTGSRTNAADSIACAKKIYTAEGTRPWLSSKDKWYSE